MPAGNEVKFSGTNLRKIYSPANAKTALLVLCRSKRRYFNSIGFWEFEIYFIEDKHEPLAKI